jgi:transcriptional regulator with XRE-family HTH domain
MTPASGTAGASSDSPSSAAATVREILEEARRVTGSGARLAARLEELGIGPPDTNRYSESAVSNWIRGRTMPPADVLVAASSIAGYPLERAGAGSEPDEHVQSQIDALKAAVIDLYGRLGYARPNLDTPAATDTPHPRSAAG